MSDADRKDDQFGQREAKKAKDQTNLFEGQGRAALGEVNGLADSALFLFAE